MTKPQDGITLIRAGNFSRLAKLVADAGLVWCDTCHDHVMPDDGECSCGEILDMDAFEAADKRLAEANADPDAALYAAADFYHDMERAF